MRYREERVRSSEYDTNAGRERDRQPRPLSRKPSPHYAQRYAEPFSHE